MSIGFALMLVAAAPGAAAPAAPPAAAVAAPDPARLAAAKALMELMMPADRRDAMIRGMIEPMIGNLRSSVEASPQFSSLLASNPKARELLLAFVDKQMRTSIDATIEFMPALLDAMAASYARQLTTVQLADVAAFYRTPAGQALVAAMPTVMAAPEIAAVQKSMMSRAFERVQADSGQLIQQLAALQTENGKAKP